MIHQLRIALLALILVISLILVITYISVTEKQDYDSYALEPVYQFTRECEEEYFAMTGKHLDDTAKTQLLSLSYKTLYRGTQKSVLNTPKKPFTTFNPQLNNESLEAMHQSKELLYSAQLYTLCKPVCPKAAMKIKNYKKN